jgi:hypothetical protein
MIPEKVIPAKIIAVHMAALQGALNGTSLLEHPGHKDRLKNP